MLLILRIRICCMIKTEPCFLFNISCITKQVGIRRFSQYFLVFFFFFFLNVKIKFLPLLLLKFQFLFIVFSNRILKWKKHLKIENLPLRVIHFPDGIYSFKVNNGITKIIWEISSKITLKTTERRQWRLDLNFNTFAKSMYCFRYVIYTLLCFHACEWLKLSVINSNIFKYKTAQSKPSE